VDKIGFVWVCFGFVFTCVVHSSLFVVHCKISTYVHFGVLEIGFVLHKRVHILTADYADLHRF